MFDVLIKLGVGKPMSASTKVSDTITIAQNATRLLVPGADHNQAVRARSVSSGNDLSYVTPIVRAIPSSTVIGNAISAQFY